MAGVPSGEGLHLHLDAVGGAAGDMFVAAMLDAFPGLHGRVEADAAAVLPPEAGRAMLARGMSGGMAVQRFFLRTPEGNPHHGHGHSHDHGLAHDHDHDHDHAHTTYAALRARIEDATLSPGTARHACAILERLALAEAAAHDMPVEEVHFHELADWDSLMDVVAAGSIAAALEGAGWSVSPLPLGAGMVKTAHGMLPVPAPATLRILDGFDWRDDGVAGERVTPTGAAILAHLVTRPGATRPGGRLVGSGMGAGTRDLPDRPNVLRVSAFATHGAARDVAPPAPAQAEAMVQLACDLDDMTGEEIAAAAEALRALEGVADLVLTSGQGKKGRLFQRLELLVDPVHETTVAAAMFERTSTLGLRRIALERMILPRAAEVLDGMRRKRAERPSGPTWKAESDDLNDAPNLAERRARARAVETG